MNLLIPKGKAIDILRSRISELDNYHFNVEAWRERTVLDLKEIFPPGSTQFIKIQFLRFDSHITSEKEKVLNTAKQTAKEILNSYIQFIEEYSRVAEERKVIIEKDFEHKYSELMKERNEIVTDYNGLIKRHEEQLDTNSELIDLVESLNEEIRTIRNNTIQFDNVSLLKLSRAFFNLPIWQIVTTLSVVIAVIVGTFRLGKVYQENAANNQLFDYKSEIKNLKDEKLKDKDRILTMSEEINILQREISRLKPKLKE